MPFDRDVVSKQLVKKYKLEFFPENNYFIAQFSGDLDMKILLDCFSESVRHPSFVKNMAVCYDFVESVIDLDINSTELFYHFSEDMREKRGSSYQLALVCSDSLTRTILELYRLMFSRTKVDVEIFENTSIALEWIKESQDMAGTL